ncbi:hypothetical protein GCM10027040_05220 [Halomonas shantousis]
MTVRNHWISWGQWLALITMTAEHIVRWLIPDAGHVEFWAILVGRIAFPLFAGMVAWHACFNTRNPYRYAVRVLLIGLIAQLPYAYVRHASDLPFQLNVCFTLGISLLAAAVYLGLSSRTSRAFYTGAALLVWFFLGQWFEYEQFGLLLVPAFMAAFHYPRQLAALAPLLMLTLVINAHPAYSLVSMATAGVLVLIAQDTLRPRMSLPAMPRQLWLAWYPLHFALIALVMVGMEVARPSL